MLCSQHVLSDSALMQTQSQADHILDALHTGSGRVKKMQENTQAMETQYKALLQSIVDAKSLDDPATGKPFLPADNFFEVVDEQFNSLLGELSNEKTQNEGLLAQALQNVVDCNTAMETSMDGIVSSEQGAMTIARQYHSECRARENGDIEDMESECGKFDELSSKCSDNQDWYAASNDASIGGGGSNTLSAVIAQADKCKDAVTKVSEQSADCDSGQSTFKSTYCSYASRVTTVCTEQNSCYTQQVANHGVTKSSVEDLEKEQKIIYKMVKKVQCYVGKLREAEKNNMPTQADIADCSSRDPDASSLTITYDDPAPQSACMANTDLGTTTWNTKLGGETPGPTNKPGVGSWYNTEFGTLTTHNTLNEDCACNTHCR